MSFQLSTSRVNLSLPFRLCLSFFFAPAFLPNHPVFTGCDVFMSHRMCYLTCSFIIQSTSYSTRCIKYMLYTLVMGPNDWLSLLAKFNKTFVQTVVCDGSWIMFSLQNIQGKPRKPWLGVSLNGSLSNTTKYFSHTVFDYFYTVGKRGPKIIILFFINNTRHFCTLS